MKDKEKSAEAQKPPDAPKENSILNDIPGLTGDVGSERTDVESILGQIEQGGMHGSVKAGSPGTMNEEVAAQVEGVIRANVERATELVDAWLEIHNKRRTGEKVSSVELNFIGKTRINDIPTPGFEGTAFSLTWGNPPRGEGKSCVIGMDFDVPVVTDDGKGLRKSITDLTIMVASGVGRPMPAKVGDGWINGSPVTEHRLQLQEIANGVGMSLRRAGGGTRKTFSIPITE